MRFPSVRLGAVAALLALTAGSAAAQETQLDPKKGLPRESGLGAMVVLTDLSPKDPLWKALSAWRKARDQRKFAARFTFGGDSLKRAPQGYALDHPLIDDLKRKDFIAVEELDVDVVLRADFADRVQQSFVSAKPLMQFLCGAQPLAF